MSGGTKHRVHAQLPFFYYILDFPGKQFFCYHMVTNRHGFNWAKGVNRSVPFQRGAVHGVATPVEARHVPVCNICENKILALLKDSGRYLLVTNRPGALPIGSKKLVDCPGGKEAIEMGEGPAFASGFLSFKDPPGQARTAKKTSPLPYRELNRAARGTAETAAGVGRFRALFPLLAHALNPRAFPIRPVVVRPVRGAAGIDAAGYPWLTVCRSVQAGMVCSPFIILPHCDRKSKADCIGDIVFIAAPHGGAIPI
jgi:hypothetical protein